MSGTRAVAHRLSRGTAAARREDGPTRKTARHLLHVLLRVAAVYAQSVQFHQFARVVFIDAASLPPGICRRLGLTIDARLATGPATDQRARRVETAVRARTLARATTEIARWD